MTHRLTLGLALVATVLLFSPSVPAWAGSGAPGPSVFPTPPDPWRNWGNPAPHREPGPGMIQTPGYVTPQGFIPAQPFFTPGQPPSRAVWVPEHWAWNGYAWVWVPAHWEETRW